MMQKKEFNQAANDSNPRSDRIKRFQSSGVRIVEYADIAKQFAENPQAGEELRAKMEKLMAPIEADPTNLKAIGDFGVKPIQEMGEIAKRVLAAQTKMNEDVKTMSIKMSDMENNSVEAGMRDLMGALKKATAAAGGAAVDGAKGIGGLLKKGWEGIVGKKKRTPEEEHIYHMIENLPKMYADMLALTKSLSGAEAGIADLIKEAENLGKARTKMVTELNVNLGCCKEILRRYDEVYIPEMEELHKENGDEETRAMLLDTVRGKEVFASQYIILESSRAQGIEAATHLRAMIEMLQKQRGIIQRFKIVREAEWAGLMASAGLTASNLKIAQMIKSSEEAGDRLHDMGTHMQKTAHEMTMHSETRGTVDTKKLLDALENRQRMLEEEAEVRKQRMIDGEQERQQLRAAAEKLLDASEKNLKDRVDRIIEASEEMGITHKGNDADDAVETPVTDAVNEEGGQTSPSNDNVDADDEAVKPVGRKTRKKPTL